VTLGDNPNYTVVSTNGILSNSKSIAVVIADGKSKYTGMKILRLLLWLLVLSMAAIPSTILATTASQFSNVGQYPIDVTLG
jgi:archaellum biogenesis protein FlaJ (TadC family)